MTFRIVREYMNEADRDIFYIERKFMWWWYKIDCLDGYYGGEIDNHFHNYDDAVRVCVRIYERAKSAGDQRQSFKKVMRIFSLDGEVQK